MGMPSNRVLGPSFWGILLALSACSGPLGPELEEIEVDLAEIRLSVVETGGVGQSVLEVHAALADPSRSLAPHERVRVTLLSNAGDEEDILLGPALCEDDSGSTVDCYRFVVSTVSGVNVGEIREEVSNLGAELIPAAICSNSGGCEQTAPSLGRIVVFDPTNLSATMKAVGALPQVAYVERLFVGTIMSLSSANVRLYAPVELRDEDVRVGDQTLQILSSEPTSVTAVHSSATASVPLGS